MKKYFENLAKAMLGQPFGELTLGEQKVIESIAHNTSVSENVNLSFRDTLTLSQRISDRIAAFVGSWTFIGLFSAFILGWILVNTIWLINKESFDPYPFILLNLGLSTLAAFQAPVIMMSQNRQAAKDRIKQDASYAINLKLELELMMLHRKLDEIHRKIDNEEN